MPWLRSGTVACTLNSTTVTGTGTGFVANARVGDAFLGPDGRWYEVANIASDTALSILPAYQGATVSAGSYALAPMQGYVKDSADQLRTLVNKFGTLAAAASINALVAVTGGANKIAYFTAADQMAVADFPAQARTLLAANTQTAQRTALALGSAAVASIVGTVSQSSGLPTGAIIETGTNSNGTYTKFADGTMICIGVSPVQTTSNQYSATGIYYAANAYQSFPVAFVGTPRVMMMPIAQTVSFSWVASDATPSNLSFTSRLVAMGLNATAQISFVATGRWF